MQASDEGKTSPAPSSPAPRGSVQSKAAIFTNKQEEKPVSVQENVTKLDQTKMAFLTQSKEPEISSTEKAAPSQLDESKIEGFTSTEMAVDIVSLSKVVELLQPAHKQHEEIKSSSVEIQEEEERKPIETKAVKEDTKV